MAGVAESTDLAMMSGTMAGVAESTDLAMMSGKRDAVLLSLHPTCSCAVVQTCTAL